MQLACGLIDKQNWADINAHLADKVSADGARTSPSISTRGVTFVTTVNLMVFSAAISFA
jgi:hypothetical protein